MKLLLAGASGLVGSHVLALALADARVAAVTAPVRRPLPSHPKLLAPTVDFEALPEAAAWWQADAAICALGTTMGAAGSREAFRRVDHAYPLAVARHARTHGTPAFVLNSAMSANPSSWFFYSRVKGALESDLDGLGFPSLTIVRPGLIGGTRQERRPAERLAILATRMLTPILPRSLRINPAKTIAAVMLEAAIRAQAGRHLVVSADLVGE